MECSVKNQKFKQKTMKYFTTNYYMMLQQQNLWIIKINLNNIL